MTCHLILFIINYNEEKYTVNKMPKFNTIQNPIISKRDEQLRDINLDFEVN